jgi:hypothetical protein
MENSMEIPQEIKNKTTIWSTNPATGYLPKENEVSMINRLCTATFMKSTSHPSVHSWIQMVHTHKEYHSVIKKNEVLSFVTMWVNLEGIMLSEISQA